MRVSKWRGTLVLALAVFARAGLAGTASTSFTVQGTVIANCTVSVPTGISFSYDPVVAQATTTAFAADAVAPTSASTSFNPTATVIKNCSISAPAQLNFGTYDPTSGTNTTGTATLTVSCTRNTPATIALDNGGHFGTATGFAT